ncbi:MAG: response regulator [Spirulinaceae cyanobacterium SM2_1_0]|nr:response regulator [Spirulinaceae cyanobacterium SM2_1_0]
MPESSASPSRILIVDDNAHNIAIIFDALQDLGYELRIARDGQSALTKVSCESPDLILLDVMMPGIDGFETCRRLKANPETADVPVIFMTGMGETADRVRGFAAGGIDYLVKPVRLPELRARLTTHLTLNQLQRQLQTQNQALKSEVQRRQQVEAQLRDSQRLLEQKVAQRTEELRAANDLLAQKIQALQVAEADLQQTLATAETASAAKSQFLAK